MKLLLPLCIGLVLLSVHTYSQDTLRPSTHEIDVEDLLKSKAFSDEFEDELVKDFI